MTVALEWGMKAQSAEGMVHSVKIEFSDISNALPYALCALRFASNIEDRASSMGNPASSIENRVSSIEYRVNRHHRGGRFPPDSPVLSALVSRADILGGDKIF